MHRRDFLRLSSAAAAYATACPFFFGQISKNLSELSASDFHAARRFLTTSQGRISHLDIGKGPAALFLHGFPLNSFQWRGILPQLAKTHRCIAPDFLGLGYTEVAEGQEVTSQAQVAMLAELLDKLSIADIDIVANDSGGAVAQLFSVRYPHRVKSLFMT
ncbi:MAG: alpha/beta fold hydrolase, partial [Acidobacteriaceae bacterium]|nr:alpha/beta fold hydrolase [Acidobacteriaceae bacterium]